MPVARLSTFFINIKKRKEKKVGSLSAAVSFPSSQTALPFPVWPPRYANRYVRISCWIITIHYPVLISGLILHVHSIAFEASFFQPNVKGESWVNTICTV